MLCASGGTGTVETGTVCPKVYFGKRLKMIITEKASEIIDTVFIS